MTNDGKEVVAKIPYPNAGQPHFTTASEVATMKFAREVLNTDLPEVYDWCSRAEETPVGAEYILMEKMEGVELEHVWPNMAVEDRVEVVKAIAAYQMSWASVSFEQYGSLYLAEDFGGGEHTSPRHLVYTDDQGRRVEDSRFVVGPTTSHSTFDHGRGDIDFDRGPWSSLEEYHVAIEKREIACVQHVPHIPQSSVSLRGPGLYEPNREKKLTALECYLKLLKYLLPADRSLGSSHLWHGDLHAGNIFVDPRKPTRIVGLIDWQSIELSPLYFHARLPQFIEHDGPKLQGLERPDLPPDYDDLEDNAKKAAYSLYWDQMLCSMYRFIVHLEMPNVFDCFEFEQSKAFPFISVPRSMLVDGEPIYLAKACELEKEWDTIPGAQDVVFPLTFTTSERQTIEQDRESFFLAVQAMNRIKKKLGKFLPDRGYVPMDEHKEAVEALAQETDDVLSLVEAIIHGPNA
ncbi:hypothetical protein E4U56_006960 [Claviceps arundinis]|uniref:Aminoglycoside phosphotransferase domain-containing protein n=1 Tax=Claviceps arundinis TaxID=1623583 RepID=A0A9P7MLH1_9HYPO|nr:hypothetical protein E4U56_006960 [Claviceps arundinis]